MATVGIATGAGRGMGYACAQRLATMVDHLVLVDLDDASVRTAAAELSGAGTAKVEPFALDVTDESGLARLADQVAATGTLRAVAHAAGISPTMADWRRIVGVDLMGTARWRRPCVRWRPRGRRRCASRRWLRCSSRRDPPAGTDEALDEPLHEELLDRLHDALGAAIEGPARPTDGRSAASSAS